MGTRVVNVSVIYEGLLSDRQVSSWVISLSAVAAGLGRLRGTRVDGQETT